MSEILVETRNLTKAFGKRNAVENVNIKIKKGSIYGLIGKNGAGKTTLMRMMSGMCRPTSGSYEYVGCPGGNAEAYGRIGSLIEIPALMPQLTAYDNLKLKSIAYDCFNDGTGKELLWIVGLGGAGDKIVRRFSLGMKQRLGIAMALVGDPDILYLDEPINGLDPEGIAEIRDMLTKVNREKGTTIIISSHILAELAKVATEFAIIDSGRIVDEFSVDRLESKRKGKLIVKCADALRAKEVLFTSGHTDIELADGNTLYVYEEGDPGPVINMEICKAGILVYSFEYESTDLEQYYLDTVKDSFREA